MTVRNAFDASAWAGPWPFGDGGDESLGSVIGLLREAGVQGAVFSPLRALLAPEPTAANLDLCREIAASAIEDFDVRFLPVVDPSLPHWRDQIASCRGAGDVPVAGIKLIPNYHTYLLADSFVQEVAAFAVERGLPLCIQVRMLDERAHHPRLLVPGVPVTEIVALAAAHPSLSILACGLYNAELAAIASAANVSVELSSVESGDTLPNVLTVLPPDRVLLGTHAPIYYPAPALAKLRGDGIGEDALAAIAGGNARALFGNAGARS